MVSIIADYWKITLESITHHLDRDTKNEERSLFTGTVTFSPDGAYVSWISFTHKITIKNVTKITSITIKNRKHILNFIKLNHLF